MSRIRNLLIIIISLLAFSCTHLRSDNFNARHYLYHRFSETKPEDHAEQNARITKTPIALGPENINKAEKDTTKEPLILTYFESDSNTTPHLNQDKITTISEELEQDSLTREKPLMENSDTDKHSDAVDKIVKYNRLGFLLGNIGFILIGASVFLFMFSTILWLMSIIIGAGLLIGAQVCFIQTIRASKNLNPAHPDSVIERKVIVAKTITVIGILIDAGILILLFLNFF